MTAWVARSELAAAVSEAGGLGVIAAAHGSAACGQSAGLIHEVSTVRDVIARSVDEAEATLMNLPRGVGGP